MPPGPYANFWTMNSSWRGTKTEAPPLKCGDRPSEGLPEAGPARVLKSPAEGKSRFPIFGTSPRSGESTLPLPGSLLDKCTFTQEAAMGRNSSAPQEWQKNLTIVSHSLPICDQGAVCECV